MQRSELERRRSRVFRGRCNVQGSRSKIRKGRTGHQLDRCNWCGWLLGPRGGVRDVGRVTLCGRGESLDELMFIIPQSVICSPALSCVTQFLGCMSVHPPGGCCVRDALAWP